MKPKEPKLSPDVQEQLRGLTDDERTINATLSALFQITGAGWSSWVTTVGQHFEPPVESGLRPFAVSIEALRTMAARARYWELLRALAGADQLTDERTMAAGTPAGLTVSEDGDLLNWLGENYTRQSTAQHTIIELQAKIAQQDDVIAELREMVDTPYPGPTTEEIRALGHAEAVELADAMIAPAGFELLRDDGAAMWIQHLKDARPGVQVFFTIPEGILAAGPANVFAFVKANVGVAL